MALVKENAPTVVVTPAGSVTIVPVVVSVMSAKVFAPVTISSPAPPWLSVGQVLPLPAKVLVLADVIEIVPTEAVTVSPAPLVAAFHPPAQIHVLEPKVSVLVPAPRAKEPIVTPKLLALNVPFVSVKARAAMLSASVTCHAPPAPLKISGKSSVLPALVMLLVPLVAPNVVALAPAVTVIPDAIVRLP